MVSKITTPPSQVDLVDKVNEIIDDKQDTLVSGTNIKTVNNTSLLGSGNLSVGTVTSVNNVSPVNGNVTLSIPTVSDTYSATSSNAMSGKAVASAVSGKQDTLVSGTSIKTINSTSLLGSGNIAVQSVIDSNNKLDYAYLSNTPTIPTVNNATLTITQGGTTKGTFTANASSNVTIDLDSGGGTVDQTYDGTSANAQSGVAIAGAGFLQNTATGSNALTILGTASTANSAVNIGKSSSASGDYGCALGESSKANGGSSVAIGRTAEATSTATTAIGVGAKVSSNYSIQLGYGTNSTASTFSVGFYASSSANRKNWQLLDGTTGLIPYERIQGITETRASGQIKIWVGTEAQYTAITTKDANTLYFKTES